MPPRPRPTQRSDTRKSYSLRGRAHRDSLASTLREGHAVRLLPLRLPQARHPWWRGAGLESSESRERGGRTFDLLAHSLASLSYRAALEAPAHPLTYLADPTRAREQVRSQSTGRYRPRSPTMRSPDPPGSPSASPVSWL